jgi:mercuric ion transport protein
MDNERTKISEGGLLAAGGVIAALAASSCCVAPLAFAAVGLSGAWIGQLTALAPYQPVFFVAAVVCIGMGLWRAYHRDASACSESQCAVPWSRRVTRGALWLAATLLAISGTAQWWALWLP